MTQPERAALKSKKERTKNSGIHLCLYLTIQIKFKSKRDLLPQIMKKTSIHKYKGIPQFSLSTLKTSIISTMIRTKTKTIPK